MLKELFYETRNHLVSTVFTGIITFVFEILVNCVTKDMNNSYRVIAFTVVGTGSILFLIVFIRPLTKSILRWYGKKRKKYYYHKSSQYYLREVLFNKIMNTFGSKDGISIGIISGSAGAGKTFFAKSFVKAAGYYFDSCLFVDGRNEKLDNMSEASNGLALKP